MTFPSTPPLRARLAGAAIPLLLLAELAVFVGLAYAIGLLSTLAAGLATTLLGAVLLRSGGLRALRRHREAAASGEPPGPAAVSSAVTFAGALLLVIPGFLTDVVGLLCVFPPTRALVRGPLSRLLESRMDSAAADRMFGPRTVRSHTSGPAAADRPDSEEVLEGEIVAEPPDTQEPRP